MSAWKAWAKVHEDFTHHLLEERIARLESFDYRMKVSSEMIAAAIGKKKEGA